jgi:hypothetical protein
MVGNFFLAWILLVSTDAVVSKMDLRFSPTLGQTSYENDMAAVVPRLDLDFSLGFTVCVRILFKYLVHS